MGIEYERREVAKGTTFYKRALLVFSTGITLVHYNS
jgi:hypothetical protein